MTAVLWIIIILMFVLAFVGLIKPIIPSMLVIVDRFYNLSNRF